MGKRALVIGGGVAGVAASLELRDRGWEVELWEARRQLGGRVFSFTDKRLGDEIDNGPHVMLGCYEQFRRLLRRIGSEGLFEQPHSLSMSYREPGGAASSLALSALPTPLAMPWALLRWKALAGGRLRAMRGMVASLRAAPADWSFGDWLRARGQDGGPRRLLWEPLCLAVMNAEPSEVAAELFLGTLRRAFGGSARSAAIWVARASWSEIIGRPALATLEREGVRVRLNARVHGLVSRDGRVDALTMAGGESFALGSEDLVVSAVPWDAFARWLPAETAGAAATFEGRAIYNVYFDYDEPVLAHEGALTALVDGRPFQFLYRKPGASPGRFVLIASACEELDGASVADIERVAREQIRDYYPQTPLPDGGRVRVTKEPAATLLATPAVAAQRPAIGRHPDLANLVLCGDWTRTGLPSTLEGAAASGFGLTV